MSPNTPNVDLSAGQSLHGFTITGVTPLDEIRCTAIQARHERSGARLLHLVADDEENLFAVAFRTPPPDDTGLPHILEHTVLCGSKRYPVKDPFVELARTSLATFLNAMTYPDKTVYPVASMNEKDFYNLTSVYCDAVFEPLITEDHFKQEGHHYELESFGDLESPLTIKGIVYNEMKGAYSDLDGIIEREMTRRLCPDNAYGYDSGGDPDAIPSLTYEQFVAFHRRYYHPSNGLFFFYGNLPTAKHLQFLDREYLEGFQTLAIDTRIEEQPRWKEPVRLAVPYPVGPSEPLQSKTAVVLTWLTNDITDATRSLSMTLLDYYLLGNSASPLRKALIDSKLGEELTDSGYAGFQRDTFFTVGLKGSEAERAGEIETLVLKVCGELADQGLDKEKVEAAFHRLEIASREIASQYPLRLMDRVYRSWLYDADPLHLLSIGAHLTELRRRYETEPRFFERQLREMILDNPHYLALTFTPDPQYMARREQEFTERMKQEKARLSRTELEKIDRDAQALAAAQGEPNTPEALATLPKLVLSDVQGDPLELPTTQESVAGRPLLVTDLFSGGLTYLNLAFDLRGLDEDLYDYVPVFAQAMQKMGAGDLDFVAMAEREAAHTGGIGSSISADGVFDDPQRVQPYFGIHMKALDSKLPQALEVLRLRMTSCNLSDRDRLRDALLQGRVQLRSQIVPAGNRFAALAAERGLSRNADLRERFGGVSLVRLLDRLVGEYDAHADELVDRLSRIRDFLLGRERVTASVVGEEAAVRRVQDWLAGTLQGMREGAVQNDAGSRPASAKTRLGIATPADVAFAAIALPAVGATHPLAAALTMLSTQLSFGYLWVEVRVKGGAYGARAGYSSLSGLASFSSYRDPRIVETLDVFRGTPDHVAKSMDLSPEALEQAIIGTLKSIDRPVRPDHASGTALGRYLHGQTPEKRRDFRQRLLSLTPEQVRQAAEEVLRPALAQAPVCVVSSREKLENANRRLGERALEIQDL